MKKELPKFPGDEVLTPNGRRAVVLSFDGEMVRLRYKDDFETDRMNMYDLRLAPAAESSK